MKGALLSQHSYCKDILILKDHSAKVHLPNTPRKNKMSGIKGFFLLFMVLGAMYLGAQAEAVAEADYFEEGESAELRGHAHFGSTDCFMCSFGTMYVQYTLEPMGVWHDIYTLNKKVNCWIAINGLFHCLLSGVCAGTCCDPTCRACYRIITNYVECCFGIRGGAFLSFRSGKCYLWSVTVLAMPF